MVGTILNVCIVPDFNEVYIARTTSVEPHSAKLSYSHLAHHHSIVGQKAIIWQTLIQNLKFAFTIGIFLNQF